jgi:predicted enzyme related to lactoylglutathione lyase
MAKIESYAPGSFCWAELATADADGAKKFYGDMFGWTAQDNPMPQGVYTIFQSGGDDVAAVYQAPPEVPTHWGVYFSVTDVDASAAQITQLGGKIVMGPMDVGEPGRMVVAQDPQGVHFSLWQAKGTIGATYGGPLGNVVWPELYVPNAAEAIAFYGALLGWKTKPETGADTAEYVEWVNAGQSMGGLMAMRGEKWTGVPSHWAIYITVANCEERAKHAVEKGAKSYVPPTSIPNVGTFSVLADPQGATFHIIQMTGAHQPATA